VVAENTVLHLKDRLGKLCIKAIKSLKTSIIWKQMYLTAPSTAQHTSATSHRHCGCRILCTLFEIHNYDALKEASKQAVCQVMVPHVPRIQQVQYI
jgi:hypothetical protein